MHIGALPNGRANDPQINNTLLAPYDHFHRFDGDGHGRS